MDLSFFKTGTIGAAHSANWTGCRIPSLVKRASSCSTLSRSAYGTWRALQKWGFASGSTKIFARKSRSSQSSSLNTAAWHASNPWRELSHIERISCQSSRRHCSQLRPSRLGPWPCTTSKVNWTCCCMYCTLTITLPRTVIGSPE